MWHKKCFVQSWCHQAKAFILCDPYSPHFPLPQRKTAVLFWYVHILVDTCSSNGMYTVCNKWTLKIIQCYTYMLTLYSVCHLFYILPQSHLVFLFRLHITNNLYIWKVILILSETTKLLRYSLITGIFFA